jgi:hypothetical protein
MLGLVPGIHVLLSDYASARVGETSPAMTPQQCNASCRSRFAAALLLKQE